MNDRKKEKLKKNLVKMELMDENDRILECILVNYWNKLMGKMGQWKRSWIYFTEKAIICPTGILDENIIIPYNSVRELGKCLQGLFPMGFVVTYEHPITKRQEKQQFSISKREKWLEFISQKTGVPTP